jgi:hypothetical protein
MNMITHHTIKEIAVHTLIEVSLDIRGYLNMVLVLLSFTLLLQPVNGVIVPVQFRFHRSDLVITHLVQSI